MVIVFLVETSWSQLATPFNILPSGLVYHGDLLELAAILPSSPYDLSHGWVRPRHILGSAPEMHFYSKEYVNEILSSQMREPDCVIFFSREDYSYGLIEKFLESGVPCVLVTDNSTMAKHFEPHKSMRIVLYEDASGYETFSSCFKQVAAIFGEGGETDFSGKPVSASILDSFCLEKSFLPQTRVKRSPLCVANQIVLSQTRGKFPEFQDIDESGCLQSDKAYYLNVDIMDEILSERLVDIMLGVENQEPFVEPPENVSQALLKQVKGFVAKLPKMSMGEKRAEYSILKQAALCEMGEIHSRNEVVLLIPTVNIACRNRLLSEYQKTLPLKEMEELGHVVDQMLFGGRGISKDERKLTPATEKIAWELGNSRIDENKFITFLIALFASRRLSPVLKSTTVPSSLFRDILQLRAYVGDVCLSGTNNLEWCLTTGQKFRSLQGRLTSNIPQVYMSAIRMANPSSLVIASDLPFELAQFENGTAICQLFPTSRIPITPMGSTFWFYNHVNQRGFHGEALESLDDILLINSVQEDDPVYGEFLIFQSICKRRGYDLKTESIKKKDDFVSILNSRKPSILVYYGHGSYDEAADSGELVIGNDQFSFDALKEIEKVPDLIFLVGCETASCSAFFGGLPAHLLEDGAFAVLAPIFPIPAREAGAFLGQTISIIDQVLKQDGTIDFSNIVFESRKMGWMRDNLVLLQKIGAVTTENVTEIFREVSDMENKTKREKGRGIPLHERTELFKNSLRERDILDIWNDHREHVIPYSLFFTLLGDANSVLLGSKRR